MYFRNNSRPDPWCEAMQGCLDVFVDKLTRMVIVSCIIKYHKDNYHKVVSFLLTHIVLFVRIMHNCVEICELCDQLRFLINYAGLHHRTI